MGALLGSTAPARTGEVHVASEPLPRREGPPRVRLRVRIPVEILEATMTGLSALDEHVAPVLSERDVAHAPPPPERRTAGRAGSAPTG